MHLELIDYNSSQALCSQFSLNSEEADVLMAQIGNVLEPTCIPQQEGMSAIVSKPPAWWIFQPPMATTVGTTTHGRSLNGPLLSPTLLQFQLNRAAQPHQTLHWAQISNKQ